jgi:hypothetical protein
MTVPALLPAALRLLAGALTLVAVAATFFSTAARATINPVNFFGFFTIQSNLLAAAVLVATAVLVLRGGAAPEWLVLARAATTAYLVVVGLVYNTLLTGVAGGVELAWANTLLHVILPVYCLLDWLVFADRGRQPWRRLWLLLVYPALWCTVVLLRGATDGWVPYPFLNPVTGYAAVFGSVLLIAGTVLVVGAAVFALSRLRLVGVVPVRTRG